MSTPALALSHAAPSRRALALLAALVLAAHTMVLTSVPMHFAPERLAPSEAIQIFVTRSVPPQPAGPPKATPQPKPKSPRKKNEPVAVDAKPVRVPEPQPAEPVPDTPSPADLLTEAGAKPETAAASAPEAAPASPAAAPVSAVALPASVALEYKMTGNSKGMNYFADAELLWKNSGDAYNALMRVSALFLGSRSMSSSGQLGPEGLAPTRFSDKSRTEVAAHFQPDKNQISFSANTPTLAWVKGAQDRVSVFMQLGGMLAANPAGFPAGATISIYTVGPRDADTWTFLVEAEEKLALPFGELATVKLTRQPRREFDQKVEIWYAPSLGYLPVRNKITQSNGDFIDQQLTALGKG